MDFRKCLQVWLLWHNGMGFPYGGGWMQQPLLVPRIIREYEIVYKLHERVQRVIAERQRAAEAKIKKGRRR